jgi:hypothetical protein
MQKKKKAAAPYQQIIDALLFFDRLTGDHRREDVLSMDRFQRSPDVVRVAHCIQNETANNKDG